MPTSTGALSSDHLTLMRHQRSVRSRSRQCRRFAKRQVRSAIAWANENCASSERKPTFLVGDVLSLPEAFTQAFDYVLDGYCFHCIVGDDRPKFLRSAFRALRPQGILHIATMCNGYHGEHVGNYDPATRYLSFNGIASRYFGDAASIVDEITAAGFQTGFSHVDPPEPQACLRIDCRKP